MTRNNRWLLALALSVGLAFVVIMVSLKKPPQRVEQPAQAIPVRTLEITPLAFRFEVRGYGQVLPTHSWKAVTHLRGRVVWKHPELESGNLIPEGTRLLQIDPTRYQLAEASAKAELAGIEAERRELEQEARNTQELLNLEARRLDLAKRELERAKTLSDRGSMSETQYDEQQRFTLQQEQAVQSLKNQLNLIPVKRETLEARKARTETVLANAKEDLDDTHFEAPWDMRVHQTDIETGQHVSPGQVLFIADNIAQAEAMIQLEVAELRGVLSQISTNIPPETHLKPTESFINFHDQLPLDHLQVWVTPTNVPDARWPGKLDRVTSSLNAGTRTVQAVISVDDPYRNARPPARPPLVRNMFVQASIAARTPEPVMVVPASSVHQGMVYLVDKDNRLQRQPVTITWRQGELIVIGDGLQPGDRLVLDDLVPAIDGTPVTPQTDASALETLRDQAAGDRP